MPAFEVHLEIAPNGETMAHVPALPGCHVTAVDQATAVAALPRAIAGYLTETGQTADDHEIVVEVVDVHEGLGPTAAGGGRAALLVPDRAPLHRAEIDGTFRPLAEANRRRLLDLVEPLLDEILDWTPPGEAMSIRRILQHVARSEFYYASRVRLDLAPPPWLGDVAMDVSGFLAGQRTAVWGWFNAIPEADLDRVTTPPSSRDDGEQWTVRKALRRLLEHEREHIAHVQEVLAAWRLAELAALHSRRSQLLNTMLSIDEATLTTTAVVDHWTARDLLAHVAYWDAIHAARVAQLLAGEPEAIADIDDMDLRNQAQHEVWRERPLEHALAVALKERAGYLAVLKQVPDAQLHRRLALTPERDVSAAVWLGWRRRHDADHAADLAGWRAALPREAKRAPDAPKFLLRAALLASRRALQAHITLVLATIGPSTALSGEWALKDVVGHIADWEAYGAEGLRQVVTGEPIAAGNYEGSIQAWNERHAALRRDHDWERVQGDMLTAHVTLLSALDALPASQLGVPVETPFGPLSPYRWCRIYLDHEQEHIAELRAELGLAPLTL